ncbi:MAG: hypothetical protein LBQ56_01925 [Synergistaceae bacterium]|nr:hypothetical protein [Synergistaceae bacterium]
MKRKIFFLLLLCAICTVCLSPQTGRANDEESKSEDKGEIEEKPFFLSPNLGWFFPSSGKVKDAFGDSWGGLGVGINPDAFRSKKRAPETKGARISPYFGYFNTEHGDNEAHIIPIGIEVRWTLKEWDNVKTYLGLGLAGYAVKFEDLANGIDTGWEAAGGGRIMLQADISRWLTLEASYNAINSVEGYNFGGFSIGAEFKIYF